MITNSSPTRFSIVTVCRNAGPLIEDTLLSVLGQRGLDGATVQYLIVDGASTDDTLERIERQSNRAPLPAWLTIDVRSEPDRGLYDGLVKGLQRCSGDVVSYLNAGDYYAPDCLRVVRECFGMPGVRWLTGMGVHYDKGGAVFAAKVPYSYTTRYIRAGHYGVRRGGRFIQQESTFWSCDLNDAVDFERLRCLRFAGDQYLWHCMAGREPLHVVGAHLGGFRYHGDHLSDDLSRYKAEALTFLEPACLDGPVGALVQELLSWVPPSFRSSARLQRRLITWDTAKRSWQLRP